MPPKKSPSKTTKTKPAPLPPISEAKGQCGVGGYCCKGLPPEQCCGGTCGGSCSASCIFLGCHLAGMLTKPSTWGSIVLAAVVLWLFDAVWHGYLMMPRYLETAYMWRPESEMLALWPYCILYHGLLALVFVLAFRQMDSTCPMASIKNGALILAPMAVSTLMVYHTQIIPTDILQMWAVGYLLQGAITGLVLWLASKCCNKSKGCCGSC